MDVYLVGGAVRDELLGLPVIERDWVVVGSSPEAMLALGYQQVGRDFPVFLHPDTHDEYALARTERKTGPGHTGFVVHAGADVTLEDDLIRRDLTVNAMARNADGRLVDPHGGRTDLDGRLLRHVSPAFSEDPLRVFRVARLAAQLPGFQVAGETEELMRDMARKGALNELPAERVWMECEKALRTAAPMRFVEVLARVQCLQPWFAELRESLRIPAAADNALARYASLVGQLDPLQAQALCARLKCPKAYRSLALLVARYREVLHDWRVVDVERLFAALGEARAFKPDGSLALLCQVIEALTGADLSGLLDLVAAAAAAVSPAQLRALGHDGAELGAALERSRIEFITAARAQSLSSDGR